MVSGAVTRRADQERSPPERALISVCPCGVGMPVSPVVGVPDVCSGLGISGDLLFQCAGVDLFIDIGLEGGGHAVLVSLPSAYRWC